MKKVDTTHVELAWCQLEITLTSMWHARTIVIKAAERQSRTYGHMAGGGGRERELELEHLVLKSM